MTIFDPSDTEITEIVLPDGNTASEVIAPDGSTVFDASVIPDSGNLYANYDLKQQTESDGSTIDPLIDQSGNGYDASAIGDPTLDADGFNNHPAAVLDGSGDGWDVAPTDFDTLSQPFTLYFVLSLDATDLNQFYSAMDNGRNTERVVVEYNDAGNWGLFAGGAAVSGSTDEAVNILAVRFDGANTILEEDGTQTASSDPGTDGLTGLPIGHQNDSGSTSRFWDGRLMQLLVYDAGHNSTTRTDVNNYLASEWSITL